MPQQHVLERRAQLLGARIKARVGDLTTSLTAAQGRVPFKTPLSQNDALAWWQQHRYDGLGAKALSTLDPLSIARLDNALTQRSQETEAAALPQISDPTQANGSYPTSEVDPSAMALGAQAGE